VDDDIDITDIDSVLWAMAWRVQPHRDIQVHRGRLTDLDPSAAPVETSYSDRTFPDGLGGSGILIDATMKWPYPPVSLPNREFMEHAAANLGRAQAPDIDTAHPLVRLRTGLLAGQLGQGHQADEPRTLLGVWGGFRKLRTESSYYETGVVVPPGEETP
jgi:3-polyprenyl-4-hydroxybenzoate decarboxylase